MPRHSARSRDVRELRALPKTTGRNCRIPRSRNSAKNSFNSRQQLSQKHIKQMTTEEKKDVYSIITERIVSQLEAGTVPWRKPWKAQNGGNPANFGSRKVYRGINWFLLSFSPYSCPFWLTYKQAAELKGNVRKGEKGTPVVFWNWVDSKTEKDATGKPKKIPFLKYYTVFNVEQCEGIEWKPETIEGADFNPISEAESIVRAMPRAPALAHGGDRAYYRPSTDSVQMPKAETFDTAGNYYSTLFHELAHSTGHASRLNRKGVAELAAFGGETYAKEELVAEMGAAFLCAVSGIDNTLPASASYIQGWLKQLKEDAKLVVHAAAQGQRAADFILGKMEENHEE
jgi:antirestriction protein ArdC